MTLQSLKSNIHKKILKTPQVASKKILKVSPKTWTIKIQTLLGPQLKPELSPAFQLNKAKLFKKNMKIESQYKSTGPYTTVNFEKCTQGA